MFNRILVPLDGSPLAERAIPHALHFARIFGGNIILLQVLDPTPYRENTTAVEPLHWQIRKTETDLYLKTITEQIRQQGVQAEHVLREGRPPENIVDFAQNENIDLLVLSTHGAGGLTRWNTSSVINKVIEKVYTPLLIVRAYHLPGQNGFKEASAASEVPAAAVNAGAEGQAAEAHRAEAQRAAAPYGSAAKPYAPAGLSVPVTAAPADSEAYPTIHYNRILLPIDSSRRAECSLPSGIGLVEGEEKLRKQEPQDNERDQTGAAKPDAAATLLLAAVIKPPELPIPAPYPEELQQLSDQFMKISRNAVHDYLEETQARIPVKTETRIVENESIHASIHELVEKENIDLVILCAHGKTGRINWPYGSVSRNYIEHGTQNVLVIQDVPRSQV